MLNAKHDSKMYTGEAEVIGLRALAHVAGDADLGPRLLSLTGLDAAGLRAGAGDPALLAATLDFLMAHEPSLLACAEAIGEQPSRLIAAREAL